MDFEVVDVGQGNDWQSPDGSRRLTFFPVGLRDVDTQQVYRCEWARKQGGGHPVVGDRVAGSVEDKGHGLRFKQDYERSKWLREQGRADRFQQDYGQVPSAPSAPSIPQGPAINGGPTTPDGQSAREKSIARMAAQKVAATYYLTLAHAGKLPGDFNPAQVAQAADFFETDAKR